MGGGRLPRIRGLGSTLLEYRVPYLTVCMAKGRKKCSGTGS